MEKSLADLNETLGDKPIVNYDTARRVENSQNFQEKFEENSEEGGRVEPTPLPRESPFIARSQKKKKFESQENGGVVDEKRVYSELEESERLRKKSRAEQILQGPVVS